MVVGLGICVLVARIVVCFWLVLRYGIGGLVGDDGWVGCCSVGFALWFG